MARRFGITTPISTYPSMVLGSSDVRLIDMTRAFASVANKGVAVTPYGIRKVVTADGRLLYQHRADEERVLVAPWVAAEMTDLLQSAVLTGTGRAAQIGRPVAGKTGTTTSNKDGWFIGFSSGLTTGVWMGRDDAKPVGGLQGGTAPARAFHDFMTVAVANRPVEQFQTQVPMPDWQLYAGRRNLRRPGRRREPDRADRWSTRTACRSARRRQDPGLSAAATDGPARMAPATPTPAGTGPGLPAAAAQQRQAAIRRSTAAPATSRQARQPQPRLSASARSVAAAARHAVAAPSPRRGRARTAALRAP